MGSHCSSELLIIACEPAKQQGAAGDAGGGGMPPPRQGGGSASVCPLRYSQCDYEGVQIDFSHESIGFVYRFHITDSTLIGFSHTAFAGLDAASKVQGE